MTTEDILQIEGIVIRLIPAQTVTLCHYSEGRKLYNGETIVERNGRKFAQEIKQNSLGKKYLVTRVNGQGNTVMFNTKYDGIGDTIESAYADYLKKSSR